MIINSKWLKGLNRKSLKDIRKRLGEVLSVPTALLFGFVVRLLMSFTSWIRAILLSYGIMDGFASNYLYKHEKFFPYQFIRYARIIANFSGIFNPLIPIIWNIGDGIYSLTIYKKRDFVEHIPRYGRIINGGLLAIFSF